MLAHRGRAAPPLLLVAVLLVLAATPAGAQPASAQPASAQPAGADSAPPPSLRPVAGAPLRIHVRGNAELRASASIEASEIRFHGLLADDAGAPIPSASIVVVPSSADPGATHPGATPLRIGPLRPCDAAAAPIPRTGADEVVVETDERGEFCAIGHAPAQKIALKLRFRGSKLQDATETTVTADAADPHLVTTLLRFEPPPETIDLDRETVTVTASLRVDRAEAARQGSPDDAGTDDPAPADGRRGRNPPSGARPHSPSSLRAGLPLVLTDERGAHVAEALTGGDGRARFEVKTAALAGPGAGELVVRFAGNTVLAKAEWAQPVARRAEVHIAQSKPIERADAEDGIPIEVDLTAARGAVSGGVVEVRRIASLGSPTATGSEGVGTGAVDEHGHAKVIAVFSAGGAPEATLALRFVPAAPWYRPGPELRIPIKLAGPGVGRQILLAIVVIAAAAWVVGGWRRSPRPEVAPGVESSRAPPSGRAGVHVVASPSDLAGWRGTVVDAHDGSPVAGARLAIIVPAFSGDGVASRAVADESGAFVLEGTYRTDARLSVDAPHHSTHEQALPPPSVLGVALITRRRALLERLVRWARQKGAPFDGAPEPTPGHVRRAAARSAAQDVEAWAKLVEHAAYGPSPVDEAAERDARGAEPRPVR